MAKPLSGAILVDLQRGRQSYRLNGKSEPQPQERRHVRSGPNATVDDLVVV